MLIESFDSEGPVLDILVKYENDPLEIRPVDPEPIVVKIEETKPVEKKPVVEEEPAKLSLDSNSTEAEIKAKEDSMVEDEDGVSRKESITQKLSLIKRVDSNKPRPLSPGSYDIELRKLFYHHGNKRENLRTNHVFLLVASLPQRWKVLLFTSW